MNDFELGMKAAEHNLTPGQYKEAVRIAHSGDGSATARALALHLRYDLDTWKRVLIVARKLRLGSEA